MEFDIVEIVSGLNSKFVTLGSPITMLVPNLNMNPSEYNQFKNVPRPGHADFTYL